MHMDPNAKRESLLELIKEMKRLQGKQGSKEPKVMALEISAQKLSPKGLKSSQPLDLPPMDEQSGMNPSELQDDSSNLDLSIKDQAEDQELASEDSMEDRMEESTEDEDQGEMKIPEGLLKLLAEQLHK